MHTYIHTHYLHDVIHCSSLSSLPMLHNTPHNTMSAIEHCSHCNISLTHTARSHIQTHACAHKHAHTAWSHIHTHRHTHTQTHTHTCACTQTCTHSMVTHAHTCAHTQHAHTCTHMCVYTHAHTHTHAHSETETAEEALHSVHCGYQKSHTYQHGIATQLCTAGWLRLHLTTRPEQHPEQRCS